MKKIEEFSQYIHWILLAAILIFSAFLNFWNVWNQGFSNEYYAAAVKSILVNPGIMFFNSFDPGGFITIDKPPVGIWVQTVSALIFGYSGWSLVLPQALAGVGSVFLVYLIVSRPFGKPAGLISAFALSITPIFVAISRNGTQDGIMIFILLLALFAVLKATRERSLPYLLLSMVLVGIGFNIKMIQAFIIVPALLILYLYGAKDITLKNRAIHLILAIGLLLIVSFSWAIAVDAVPANERPYIGGSGDNSVIGLIINYNGIHRLENGMDMGGRNGSQVGPGFHPGMGGIPENISGRDNRFPFDNRTAINGTGGPPGGGMNDTGTPGLFRLFGGGLGGQLSWLLPFALIGLLAWLRRPLKSMFCKTHEKGIIDEKALVLIGMFLWLLPGLIYFSFTTGFWHPYYLATIAPPIAALVGIGAFVMYQAYQRTDDIKGWLIVLAILVTGLVEVQMLLYTAEWSGILTPIVLVVTVLSTVILAGLKISNKRKCWKYSRIVAIIGIAILFVSPLVWAFTPLLYGDGGTIPGAGPGGSQRGGNFGGTPPGNSFGTGPLNYGLDYSQGYAGTAAIPGGLGPGRMNLSSSSKLKNFLISHRAGEKWILAVTSAMGESSSLIIETGYPVMALGGFSGTDRVLSTDNLAQLIKDGKVKYFLVPSQNESGGASPGGGMFSGNTEIFSWVANQCTKVPSTEWRDNATSMANILANTNGQGDYNRTSILNNPPGMMQGPGGMGGDNNLYDCSCVRNQT